MIQFYMTPGSCSTGIHILLEEVGVRFQVNRVNLTEGDEHKPEYLSVNPRGSVPALTRNDGRCLTTFESIALWLGKTYRKANLIPEGLDSQLKVTEAMNFAIHHMHGQGFARYFTPEKFSITEQDAVKQQGLERIEKDFQILASYLTDYDYVVEQYSIADAAIFYIEFWAYHAGIAMPEVCEAHFRRILSRSAVQQVMVEEGYSEMLNTLDVATA